MSGAASDDPPVRVRLQRQDTARRLQLDMAEEIDAQTALGEALIESLVRAQLRLAAIVLIAAALTLGMLPLAFKLAPAVHSSHIAGVPLPWFLLGFLAYPLLLALGWYYVVHAERNEAAFLDLMDQR